MAKTNKFKAPQSKKRNRSSPPPSNPSSATAAPTKVSDVISNPSLSTDKAPQPRRVKSTAKTWADGDDEPSFVDPTTGEDITTAAARSDHEIRGGDGEEQDDDDEGGFETMNTNNGSMSKSMSKQRAREERDLPVRPPSSSSASLSAKKSIPTDPTPLLSGLLPSSLADKYAVSEPMHISKNANMQQKVSRVLDLLAGDFSWTKTDTKAGIVMMWTRPEGANKLCGVAEIVKREVVGKLWQYSTVVDVETGGQQRQQQDGAGRGDAVMVCVLSRVGVNELKEKYGEQVSTGRPAIET